MQGVKIFTLRLPEELHATLAKLAEEDLRSLHAEILVLLKEAVVARQIKEQQQE